MKWSIVTMMTRKAIPLKVSPSFLPLFGHKERYLVMVGGAGSGKSEFAGRKIFTRCMEEGGHRFLILRKVRATLRESCLQVILNILSETETPYAFNKSDRIITFGSSSILFEGLDDREKIKSIKGITSIWMEEATEFAKEDFLQIDLRLREETPYYKQIMMTFNPDEAEAPWLKEEFFWTDDIKTGPGKKADSFIHHSTIKDNPIKAVRHEYRRILDGLGDETYLKIYRRGMWAAVKGLIFPTWDVVPLPHIRFDEVFFGGDFGYSIDPAALIKIYRKANEYWLDEVIYETKLTNPQLARKMRGDSRIYETLTSYWDSAEPKSIQELFDEGINAKPAIKGPDSVRAGIDYVKSVIVHIVEGSHHIIAERKKYKWKEDKNGNSLNIPVEFEDHAMSAIRYGIYTNALEAGQVPEVIILGEGREQTDDEQVAERYKEVMPQLEDPPEFKLWTNDQFACRF